MERISVYCVKKGLLRRARPCCWKALSAWIDVRLEKGLIISMDFAIFAINFALCVRI